MAFGFKSKNIAIAEENKTENALEKRSKTDKTDWTSLYSVQRPNLAKKRKLADKKPPELWDLDLLAVTLHSEYMLLEVFCAEKTSVIMKLLKIKVGSAVS